MRYHNITKDDMLNGEGLRIVLWVSGCSHACTGCQNFQTWDEKSGVLFDESAEEELFSLLKRDYVSGLTLSGGDPLFPPNQKPLLSLIKKFKQLFPHKTIWLYTGFLFEEISHLPLIQFIDILVDGKYIEAEKDPSLHWRGSSNQKIVDVQASLKEQKTILYQA